MRLLLDTHVLMWTGLEPARLRRGTRDLFEDPENTLIFSVISVIEVAIKYMRGRVDFHAPPDAFRHDLLNNGLTELPLLGDHALALERLPAVHGDPFDRLLVAQALVEGLTLVTADEALARYPVPILRA